jgi:hypothetical protein
VSEDRKSTPHDASADVGRAHTHAASGSSSEEWRVTLKGPRLELVMLERLAAIPGDVKNLVVSIDGATGAWTNVEVLDGSTRRALTPEEYTHLTSVYMAAYATAPYAQNDASAEYWRRYFESVMTPATEVK